MTQSISSLSGRTTGKGTVPAAVFAIAVLLGLGLNAETIELSAPFGRYSIDMPEFPEREYRIEDYGARTGEVCTAAIDAAVRECSRSGGGRVVVPRGTWFTGAVRLRSGCMLRLEEGAVLEFIDDPKCYPVVQTTWEGVECMNHSPLVYAVGATNVADSHRLRKITLDILGPWECYESCKAGK